MWRGRVDNCASLIRKYGNISLIRIQPPQHKGTYSKYFRGGMVILDALQMRLFLVRIQALCSRIILRALINGRSFLCNLMKINCNDVYQDKVSFLPFFFPIFGYLLFFSYLCNVEQNKCVRTQYRIDVYQERVVFYLKRYLM